MLRLVFGRVAGSRIGAASNRCSIASLSTSQIVEDSSEPASGQTQFEHDAANPLKNEGDQVMASMLQFKGVSNRIIVDGFLFSSCMYRKDDDGSIQSATFQLRHHEFQDGLQQDMFTVKIRLPRTILYALNNLHAGCKVRVKGRLGLKNSSGEIAIIANHVALLNDAKPDDS